jgi:hypothetical protein
MSTQAELEQHYHDVTGNSPRPKQETAPDFEGYFRKSFAEIDLLLMEEADGN